MPSTENPTFHSVAEEFLRQHREGLAPSIDQYAVDFPHLSEEIATEFPTLLLAEQLKASIVPPEDQPLEIPKRIQKYVVGKQLGKGGMGIVYAATHADLGSKIALKLLPFSKLKSNNALKRFNIEARSCAKMDHPNIVQVVDHGIESDFAYIAMRRIEGVSLDKLVEGLAEDAGSEVVSLDWTFISQIGGATASALHYAHEHGIVHRDIKPANLILDKNGKIWVTDFGLAKLLQSNLQISTTGDIVGTPRYMAPEQLRGACDERSDIYSLGLTLYELASGRPVWETLSGRSLLVRRQSLELPDVRDVNPAIPEDLASIIMNACAFQPSDRFQTAQELSYALNQYAHGSPVVDRRRQRELKARWRRRAAQIGFVASVMVLAAAIAVGYSYYAQPKSPYSDSKAAIAILQDDAVRGEFVKALPDLLNDLARESDPNVRSMVGEIASEVVDDSVEFDNPQDSQAMRQRVQTVMKPYTEGEIDGDALLENVADLVNEVEDIANRLQTVAQYVVESDGSRLAKTAMLRTIGDTLKHLVLGTYDDESLSHIRYQLDLFDAALLDSREGPVAADVIAGLLKPIKQTNAQFRQDLENAERVQASAGDSPRAASENPRPNSRTENAPTVSAERKRQIANDARRVLDSLTDKQRAQAMQVWDSLKQRP